jgi:capsule polysaccharide export protein KpsE/RkpR
MPTTSNDSTTTAERPANLAPLVIDLIRTVRVLKAEHAATAELLSLALDQLRDLNRKLDIARGNSADRAEHNRVLLAEIKALKAEIARLQRSLSVNDSEPSLAPNASDPRTHTEAVQ